MGDGIQRILCLASHDTGHDFLRQCAEMGVRPTVLTVDALKLGAWPRDAVEDVATMPPGLTADQILNTVSWMARGRRFDRIIALDEAEMQTAARLREHLRVPGMGPTTTTYYCDRLAQRMSARESGFLTPEFCPVLNYDELREFMERVPAPWLLRPRAKTSALRVRRIADAEELWRTLDELGDLQSRYLLEQRVDGDIFYVDALINECDVKFSMAHRHTVAARTGREAEIWTTHTLDRAGREWMELTALNAGLAPSLGMVRGVTHARYLRGRGDGKFFFLEIAAGVAGTFTAQAVEAASGVNLWREWARLEVGWLRGETYVPQESYETYAGCVVSPSSTEPELARFRAPEIAAWLKNGSHSGLLLRDGSAKRVSELLEQFSGELARRVSERVVPEQKSLF